MDLSDYLRTQSKILPRFVFLYSVEYAMDVGVASFAVAQMVLQLEYLHSKSIVYRDFKPENIIVDAQGYLKLIDFGTSKIIKDRTHTLTGSIYYLAPEVVTGEGHGFEIDLWSLGIVFYELICGYLPFGDEEEDPREISK